MEADKAFIATAWIPVVIFALRNQLGSYVSSSFFSWMVGTGIGTLTSIAGFAIAAAVINWVGRGIYNAKVAFDELVRTIGLVSVWTEIGVLGVPAAFSGALACILGPVIVISWIAMVVVRFVAVHEALDVFWRKTLITVIVGFIPWAIIMALAGVDLSLLDLTATWFDNLLGL